MRLSIVLNKRIRHDFLPVYIKKQWRDTGCHMVAKRLRVPAQILIDNENTSTVTEVAEDMFTSTRYADELSRTIEIGATANERATWEEERERRMEHFISTDPRANPLPPTLLFDPTRLFSRDIAQACMLTNTVVRTGEPSGIKSIYDQIRARFESQGDEGVDRLISAVEQSVLHAHFWHTDEDLLPRRYDSTSLIWKFKAEFGIHPTRVARYLLQNLFRICELESHRLGLTSKFRNDGLPARWLLRDRLLDMHFNWDGHRRVQFSQSQDLVLSSSNPTPLFENNVRAGPTDQDLAVVAGYQERMHLISPLIDLTSTTHYLEQNAVTNKSPIYLHPNLITVNMALPNTWSDFTAPEKVKITVAQRQAVGIMNCYASAVDTARRLYGNDVVNLPCPIALEAVCTDGVFFDFIAFQLNTIHTHDWNCRTPTVEDPINFAWILGDQQLVDKQYPRRNMLRSTRYVDLVMPVFYRLFASYIYGAKTSEGIIEEENVRKSSGVF